jgi:hypothetical protein
MRLSIPVVWLLVLSAPLSAQPRSSPGPAPGSSDQGGIARQYAGLIPDLIESLKDTDADVRQHAAMALSTLGAEVLKPLTGALEDPVNEKRAAAAYALGLMGYEGREAMPALLKILKDEDASVRRAASQAISRILSDEMIEPSYGMPRNRGRHGNALPKLTIPGSQSGPLPPLDPVPSSNHPKNDKPEKREPPK